MAQNPKEKIHAITLKIKLLHTTLLHSSSSPNWRLLVLSEYIYILQEIQNAYINV